MVEAARTTASTGATWAIVIVSVSVLAFWLVAIFLADRSQVRASGRARAATWPAYAGPSARGEGETPTRADIPAQAAPGSAQPGAAAGRPAMPTQRTGDSDRAERSNTGRSRAGQGPPEEENPGR
jgi:hypothetical protein